MTFAKAIQVLVSVRSFVVGLRSFRWPGRDQVAVLTGGVLIGSAVLTIARGVVPDLVWALAGGVLGGEYARRGLVRWPGRVTPIIDGACRIILKVVYRVAAGPRKSATQLSVRQLRSRQTGQRAEADIRARWVELMVRLKETEQGEQPQLEAVRVGVNQTVLVVTPRMDQIGLKELDGFAGKLAAALDATSYRLERAQADPRAPMSPRRVTVTLDHRSIPDRVEWTSPVPFVDGDPVLGVDNTGEVVVLEREGAPHLGLSAGTRGGKSSMLGALAVNVTVAGEQMTIIDGKGGTEELRGLPCPVIGNDEFAAQFEAVRRVYDLGRTRMAEIRAGASRHDFQHVWLVFDEWNTFVRLDTSKQREQIVEWAQIMVNQHGEARIHLVFAGQDWTVAATGEKGASAMRAQLAWIAIRPRSIAADPLKKTIGQIPDTILDALPDRQGAAVCRLSPGGSEVRVVQLGFMSEQTRKAISATLESPLIPHDLVEPPESDGAETDVATVASGGGCGLDEARTLTQARREAVRAAVQDAGDTRVTITEICRVTGVAKGTVDRALKALEKAEVIRKDGQGWVAA